MYLIGYEGVADRGKLLKVPNALCLVHMDRKPIINRGIFQVGACTNLKYFMKNTFVKKFVPYKVDRGKLLKVTNASCLVHMNTIPFI